MVVACSSADKATMNLIDTIHSELREAAFRIWEEGEVIGSVGLINHVAKACFVQ
jgi:hypothetical protein